MICLYMIRRAPLRDRCGATPCGVHTGVINAKYFFFSGLWWSGILYRARNPRGPRPCLVSFLSPTKAPLPCRRHLVCHRTLDATKTRGGDQPPALTRQWRRHDAATSSRPTRPHLRHPHRITRHCPCTSIATVPPISCPPMSLSLSGHSAA